MSRWRWTWLSLGAVVLVACGGGGGGSSTPAPSDDDTSTPTDEPSQPTAQLTLAVAEPAGISVDAVTLVGSQRSGRTTFDYTYRVTVTNSTEISLQNVSGNVTSSAAATVVTDGTLGFGDIAAGVTIDSSDTFTIRHDRLVSFNGASLSFVLAEAPPAVVAPSSIELIERALDNGEIDDEIALVYKVYAAFGDSRLPTQYQGDDSRQFDSPVMGEAAERFAGLSAPNQALIAPFLVPPAYEESWWGQQQAAAGQIARRAASSAGRVGPLAAPCPGCPSTLWASVSRTNGRVKVWWQVARTQDEALAADILDIVEDKVWGAETALMGGLDPLSDSGQAQNGGDGLLDIYLAALAGNARGLTVAYQPGCKARPAFIVISPSATRQMRSVVAHEFFHTLQFTFNVSSSCREYEWLSEATAHWAMDYVYPGDNYEQERLGDYIWYTEYELDYELHAYGAYIFPFYLARSQAPSLISGIWDKTTSFDSLEAIDQTIPDGFKGRWPEFALYNWNRETEHHYKDWDGVTKGAALVINGFASREQPAEAALNGAQDRALALDPLKSAGQKHLTSTYFHYRFDDAVRTAIFYNGSTYELNEVDEPDLGTHLVPKAWSDPDRDLASVQAIRKVDGVWQNPEDWTGLGQRFFCRDRKSERIDELVLIFGNAQFRDRSKKLFPPDKPPTLWLSNMGCWKWVGTADRTETLDGVTRTLHADVTFEPVGDGTLFNASGTLAWSISGTDSGDCTYSGSDSAAIELSAPVLRELVTFNDYSAGNVHRGYFGFGYADQQMDYRALCPVGSEGQFENFFLSEDAGLWLPAENVPLFKVGTGGNRIDGTYIVVDGAEWRWHFDAVRE